MNWEPHWLFWEKELALQRALTAETAVERLQWQKTKLENRLQRHVHKLKRRGWLSVPIG